MGGGGFVFCLEMVPFSEVYMFIAFLFHIQQLVIIFGLNPIK